ncbi:hypothetical protein HL666_22030 [Bradyrhizobium sp. 83002]|uniref:hypothetical protein n=1 Tax=Bradyrhizobium aeschynomenes TaxID=2734909 RepID=UPI00155627FA|nr:hypothetical protein [Bradyrhizobium aeschynomenes]NPU13451.1 hypothetical protein [Bradyrhizobium aeschynomenes]
MSLDETLRILASVEPSGLMLDEQAVESNPDAVLVALGRSFEALSAELATLQQQDVESAVASCDAKSQMAAAAAASVDRIEAVLSSLDPIERAIMAIPAKTVVGLGVKARHAAYVLSNYWTDVPERLDWDARTVRHLIESACSVAGVDLS